LLLVALAGCGGEDECWMDLPGPGVARTIAIGGEDELYVAGEADEDLFISKYDASGVEQWTRQLGSPEYDYVTAVTTDARGDVHVVGVTFGALDGNAHDGEDGDPFVTKFDGAGAKLWTRQFGLGAKDRASGVASDGRGAVYVAAATASGLSEDDLRGFLVKFDADGVMAWSRQLDGEMPTNATAVTTDADGNAYVAGYVGIKQNEDLPHYTHFVLVTKVDPSGAAQWTYRGEGF
jgi:hypothetical protein